jgi:hypothetical protein
MAFLLESIADAHAGGEHPGCDRPVLCEHDVLEHGELSVGLLEALECDLGPVAGGPH